MKILLLGKNGQVGFELQQSLSPLGQLIALDRHSDLCGDLKNLSGIAATIDRVKPDVIVNAAAYTAVDKAELERDEAYSINAAAPAVLANKAASIGALLIHYSTDYVFNGHGSRPWHEEDQPFPINYYGQSKWAGEEAIKASACDYFIFRTSWVYGRHGQNFIRTILKLAEERESLQIVFDQIGVPTCAKLLASYTAQSIQYYEKNSKLKGLYHLVPCGETNWYELAVFIVSCGKESGLKPKLSELISIPTTAYQTAARRPLNSRLDCEKIQQVFSWDPEPWELGVRRFVQALFKPDERPDEKPDERKAMHEK